jgi:hypothetical protein
VWNIRFRGEDESDLSQSDVGEEFFEALAMVRGGARQPEIGIMCSLSTIF